MKGNTIGSKILSVVLVILFICAALCVGSFRGWARERDKAAELLSSSDLAQVVDTRAMDAMNLSVVAKRHLPETDSDLVKLIESADMMLRSGNNMRTRVVYDDPLVKAAASLAERLPALPSVQASARDQAYITTLTRALMSGDSSLEAYNKITREFNNRMNDSLTGKLAMLLGLKPLGY